MGSGLGVSSASSRDSLSRSSMGDQYGQRGGETSMARLAFLQAGHRAQSPWRREPGSRKMSLSAGTRVPSTCRDLGSPTG